MRPPSSSKPRSPTTDAIQLQGWRTRRRRSCRARRPRQGWRRRVGDLFRRPGADGASARASLPTPGPARARASDRLGRLGPPGTGRSVHGAVQASSRYSETWMFSQLPRCAIDSVRADRRLPASISRAGISLRRRGT